MFITLQASDIDVEKLAKKLHLSAGTKAISNGREFLNQNEK
jgi:hypothetical protein